MDTMATPSAVQGGMAAVPDGTLSEVGRDLASRPYARRGVPARLEPIRILLVDDHHLVRAGLKSLLHACTDICVIGEASDGEEAIALATRVRPEVVVMDLDMPNGDGLTATQMLQQAVPGVRVLIVTMHVEQEKLLPLLAAGARGYLSKSAAERELGEAIRVVASGDVYVRPAVARALASSTVEPPRRRTDARARLARLSRREQSVVALTAQGFNGPEIGRQLGITAKTVDTYKQRIEEKLGLSHRSEYVRFALEAEILGAAHP
jgi:two-component system, NarL family, response regulator NreC